MTLEELLAKKERQMNGEPEPEAKPENPACAVLSEDPELAGRYDDQIKDIDETLTGVDKCIEWGSLKGYAKRDLECMPVFAFPDSAVDAGMESCGLIYEGSADYQRFADLTDTANHKAFFVYEKSMQHADLSRNRVVLFSDGKEVWQTIVRDGVITPGSLHEQVLLNTFFAAADQLEKAFTTWLEKDVNGEAPEDEENERYNPIDDMYKVLFGSEAPKKPAEEDESDDEDDGVSSEEDFAEIRKKLERLFGSDPAHDPHPEMPNEEKILRAIFADDDEKDADDKPEDDSVESYDSFSDLLHHAKDLPDDVLKFIAENIDPDAKSVKITVRKAKI